MEYTYDIFAGQVTPKRMATETSFNRACDELRSFCADSKPFIECHNNLKEHEPLVVLRTQEDIEGWQMTLERNFSWKPMDNLLEDSPPAGNKPLSHLNLEQVKSNVANELTKALEDIIKPKDAINPSHYASYFGDNEVIKNMQWLEAIQYLKQYRNPDIFKAAVELQARKYIDRLGGKDDEVQEIKKSIWYLKFLAAYIANGNKPIKVKDIQKLLGE